MDKLVNVGELKEILSDMPQGTINEEYAGFFSEDVYNAIESAPAIDPESLFRAVDKKSVLHKILEWLPHKPTSEDSYESKIWSEGSLILCPDAVTCEAIADFLDAVFDVQTTTGYFDPFDDAASGETDDLTGFWYIDW